MQNILIIVAVIVACRIIYKGIASGNGIVVTNGKTTHRPAASALGNCMPIVVIVAAIVAAYVVGIIR